MKGKDAERLSRKYILPHLPGFAANKSLLYRAPIGELLCAFCFEPSGFDRNGFYLWVFVQPLYVPESDIVFTFGNRLGFGWELTKETEAELGAKLLKCVRDEGLPWLELLQTPTKFIENVGPGKFMFFNPTNRHVLQAISYSQALIGDTQKALATLNGLLAKLKPPGPDNPEHDHAFFKEVNSFRDTLVHAPTAAQEMLRKWREESLAALKLPSGEEKRRRRVQA
jgi:hypothetical protein